MAQHQAAGLTAVPVINGSDLRGRWVLTATPILSARGSPSLFAGHFHRHFDWQVLTDAIAGKGISPRAFKRPERSQ